MVKCNERIQLQKGKTGRISDSEAGNCKTKGQRERDKENWKSGMGGRKHGQGREIICGHNNKSVGSFVHE